MYCLTIYYTAGYFMTTETSTGQFLWVDIMKLLPIKFCSIQETEDQPHENNLLYVCTESVTHTFCKKLPS